MSTQVEETLFPTTTGIIKSVEEKRPFKSSDGTEWHGRTVTMANDDTFDVWNTSTEVLAQFKVDAKLTYTRKLVKKNERESYKLQDYVFVIPRAERFEPMVVGKIADCISYAASYAKDVCVAENDMQYFEEYAERMYSWMRSKYLEETFE